jgi:hypothetical protein
MAITVTAAPSTTKLIALADLKAVLGMAFLSLPLPCTSHNDQD